MALDRTNMVSLLDTGSWLSGNTPNLMEIGDGVNELTENWGPDKGSSQYINMKAKSNTLKGYEFSATVEREHINDEFQTVINKGFKKFPTGKDAETFYYRYYKSDLTVTEDGATGECIKVPVIVAPSTTGGSGGDILKSAIEISGNGEVVIGTISIDADGKHTFTENVSGTAAQNSSGTENTETNTED